MPDTSTNYEAAIVIPSVADTAPLWQMLPDQTAGTRQQQIGLLRLSVSLKTAVASSFALLAPATVGTALNPLVAAAANMTSKQNGGAGPTFGQIASGWTVAPTFAVAPKNYRVMTFVGVVGETVTWEWEQLLSLQTLHLFRPPAALGDSLGLCLRNVTGGACADVIVSARWREFYPET